MIDLHYWPTPNGHKITLFLEETGLPYRIVPVDIRQGEQFAPAFLAIAPNNRMPAIVDHAPADGGETVSVFESGAILIYLALKAGRFYGETSRQRTDILQWLMWQMGGLGPMSGQNTHFVTYAPEPVPYAIERYSKEVDRLYGVMDRRLADSAFLGGDDYSIADMASYPWVVPHDALGHDLAGFPRLERWFDAIAARPATVAAYARGAAVSGPADGVTDEQRRILFGQTASSTAAASTARG